MRDTALSNQEGFLQQLSSTSTHTCFLTGDLVSACDWACVAWNRKRTTRGLYRSGGVAVLLLRCPLICNPVSLSNHPTVEGDDTLRRGHRADNTNNNTTGNGTAPDPPHCTESACRSRGD